MVQIIAGQLSMVDEWTKAYAVGRYPWAPREVLEMMSGGGFFGSLENKDPRSIRRQACPKHYRNVVYTQARISLPWRLSHDEEAG